MYEKRITCDEILFIYKNSYKNFYKNIVELINKRLSEDINPYYNIYNDYNVFYNYLFNDFIEKINELEILIYEYHNYLYVNQLVHYFDNLSRKGIDVFIISKGKYRNELFLSDINRMKFLSN